LNKFDTRSRKSAFHTPNLCSLYELSITTEIDDQFNST
jgi:hypothetical protein